MQGKLLEPIRKPWDKNLYFFVLRERRGSDIHSEDQKFKSPGRSSSSGI